MTSLTILCCFTIERPLKAADSTSIAYIAPHPPVVWRRQKKAGRESRGVGQAAQYARGLLGRRRRFNNAPLVSTTSTALGASFASPSSLAAILASSVVGAALALSARSSRDTPGRAPAHSRRQQGRKAERSQKTDCRPLLRHRDTVVIPRGCAAPQLERRQCGCEDVCSEGILFPLAASERAFMVCILPVLTALCYSKHFEFSRRTLKLLCLERGQDVFRFFY